MPTTGLANGSDIQQILDLDDHLLKQFAMLIQCLRWSHLRARRSLLAADGSERVAKLLRSEDALAGLLHREGALGAGRLRRRARALLHRLPRVLRDLRARGLRRLRGLRDRRLRRRRHERWGVLPRAKLEPGPAHSSAALPAFCD